MKRTITTLALAGAMMLLAIPAASATHVEDTSQDTAGAGTDECRPGADNDINGPWEPMTVDEFILEFFNVKDTELDPERADAIWKFCDKNRDGIACVMRQTLPDGSVFWILLDNRPFRR